MSLVYYVTAFVLGMFATPLVFFGVAPALPDSASAKLGKTLVRTGIRLGDTWLFEQKDQSTVELIHCSEDDSPGVYTVDGEDEERYKEDKGGLMMQMFGRNVGLTVEDVTAIFRQSEAAIAAEEAKKDVSPDGGEEIVPADADEDDVELPVSELREKGTVGRIEQQSMSQNGNQVYRIIEMINPFVSVPDGRTLVDSRQVESLLKHNGSTETPRRTAKNAEQAEMERANRSDLVQNASLIAAFMAGGILVYLATGSGGGGGGAAVTETVGLTIGHVLSIGGWV